MTEPVEVIRATALIGIPHGFLGRRGGVSTGIHAGLNVGWGSDDERAAIAENRRRAVEAVLPGAALVTVHQVHSPDVATVTEPWPDDSRPKADALVTNRPGLLLGVLTADCAPVLLADGEAGVIGAAHAGWKGVLTGVCEATVEAMEALGARRERIAAAIGPCIGQASYEVDAAFEARFVAADTFNARFFARSLAAPPLPGEVAAPQGLTEGCHPQRGHPSASAPLRHLPLQGRIARDGHAWFDLEGYVAARLEAAGVGTVEKLGLDTYADEARFYSYRRAIHRDEPGYGREIAVIGMLT